jgi:anti-anti-sigma factor
MLEVDQQECMGVALLELSEEVRDGAVVVAAQGEIDTSNVDNFVSRLDVALKAAGEHPSRVLVIELAEVTYFGSAGLNSILACYEQGLAENVAVRVVVDNAEVLRPIQVTNLDTVLPMFETVANAIEGVGREQ